VRLARRPGSAVEFIDSLSGETILKLETDAAGTRVAFHLYDACGGLVSDSGGLQSYPEGVRVTADEELLLLIPADPTAVVCYRLYSSRGTLMTTSDGLRTQIYGGLRVDGGPTSFRGRPAATG
jgi:hypothetical protein